MEALLPSEIARLVLGYLEEQKCTDAAKVFLETCPHLQECRTVMSNGRRFSTRVNGLTLMDIIEKFSAASAMVQERLNKVVDCEQRRPCGDLLNQLKFLVEETRSQRFVVNINVPSQNSQAQNGSPIIAGSMRKRHHSNSERDRNKRAIRSNVQTAQQLSESITSQVEATPLESLPGSIGLSKDNEENNVADNGQVNCNSQVPSYQSTPDTSKNTSNNGSNSNKDSIMEMQKFDEILNNKRNCINEQQNEELKNINVLEKCTMATSTEELLSLCNTEVQTNPYEIMESESDAIEDPIENLSLLTKELLNRTELQERIAEKINKAIVPADVSMKDESFGESTANELNSSLMSSLNIKSIVKATESDPAFETFLDEIFGQPADTDTSPDEDAESRPCPDLNDELQEEATTNALNSINTGQLPATTSREHDEGRGYEIPLKQRLRSSSRQQQQKNEDETEKQQVKEVNKEVSKEIGKDLAKDPTKDISKEIGKDLSKEIRKDLNKEMGKDLVKETNQDQTSLEDHNAAAILSIINANITINQPQETEENAGGSKHKNEDIKIDTTKDQQMEANGNARQQTEEIPKPAGDKKQEDHMVGNNAEIKPRKVLRRQSVVKTKQEVEAEKRIAMDESMAVPTLIFCSKETVGNFIQLNPPLPNILPLPTTSTSHFIPIAPKDPNRMPKPKTETLYLRTVKVPRKHAPTMSLEPRNILPLKPPQTQQLRVNNDTSSTLFTALENPTTSGVHSLVIGPSENQEHVSKSEVLESCKMSAQDVPQTNKFCALENRSCQVEASGASKPSVVESITLYSSENSGGALLENAGISAFHVEENVSLSGTGLSPYLKFGNARTNQSLSDIDLGPLLEPGKCSVVPAPEVATKPKNDVIARRTPRTLMKSRSKNHRLSLSTPRRRSSHVRALDFNTPTKSSSSRKVPDSCAAQFSPRPARSNNSVCRTSLFKSPPFPGSSAMPGSGAKLKSPLRTACRPCRVPVATRSPAPKLQGGWDRLNGISVIIGDMSPEPEGLEEPVQPQEVAQEPKQCLAKSSWDADLRKCIQVEQEERIRPARKRTMVSESKTQRGRVVKDKGPEAKEKGPEAKGRRRVKGKEFGPKRLCDKELSLKKVWEQDQDLKKASDNGQALEKTCDTDQYPKKTCDKVQGPKKVCDKNQGLKRAYERDLSEKRICSRNKGLRNTLDKDHDPKIVCGRDQDVMKVHDKVHDSKSVSERDQDIKKVYGKDHNQKSTCDKNQGSTSVNDKDHNVKKTSNTRGDDKDYDLQNVYNKSQSLKSVYDKDQELKKGCEKDQGTAETKKKQSNDLLTQSKTIDETQTLSLHETRVSGAPGKTIVKKYAQLKTLTTSVRRIDDSLPEFSVQRSNEFSRVSAEIVHQALPDMIELETPRKDKSLGIPATPRLLSPTSSVITPFVKLLCEDSSKALRSFVSTPEFPTTPCIALTPSRAEETVPGKCQPGTSSSEYYRPSSERREQSQPGKTEITQFEVIKENLPRDEAAKELKIASKKDEENRPVTSESENESSDSDSSTSTDSSSSTSSTTSSSSSDGSTRQSIRLRKTCESEVSPRKVFSLTKTSEQLQETMGETPAKDDSLLEANISETPSSSKPGVETQTTNLSSKISALITSGKSPGQVKPKVTDAVHRTKQNVAETSPSLVDELAEKRQRLIAKFREAPKAKLVNRKTRAKRIPAKRKIDSQKNVLRKAEDKVEVQGEMEKWSQDVKTDYQDRQDDPEDKGIAMEKIENPETNVEKLVGQKNEDMKNEMVKEKWQKDLKGPKDVENDQEGKEIAKDAELDTIEREVVKASEKGIARGHEKLSENVCEDPKQESNDEKSSKVRNLGSRGDSKTIMKQKVEQVRRDLFSDEEIDQRPGRARKDESFNEPETSSKTTETAPSVPGKSSSISEIAPTVLTGSSKDPETTSNVFDRSSKDPQTPLNDLQRVLNHLEGSSKHLEKMSNVLQTVTTFETTSKILGRPLSDLQGASKNTERPINDQENSANVHKRPLNDLGRSPNILEEPLNHFKPLNHLERPVNDLEQYSNYPEKCSDDFKLSNYSDKSSNDHQDHPNDLKGPLGDLGDPINSLRKPSNELEKHSNDLKMSLSEKSTSDLRRNSRDFERPLDDTKKPSSDHDTPLNDLKTSSSNFERPSNVSETLLNDMKCSSDAPEILLKDLKKPDVLETSLNLSEASSNDLEASRNDLQASSKDLSTVLQCLQLVPACKPSPELENGLNSSATMHFVQYQFVYDEAAAAAATSSSSASSSSSSSLTRRRRRRYSGHELEFPVNVELGEDGNSRECRRMMTATGYEEILAISPRRRGNFARRSQDARNERRAGESGRSGCQDVGENTSKTCHAWPIATSSPIVKCGPTKTRKSAVKQGEEKRETKEEKRKKVDAEEGQEDNHNAKSRKRKTSESSENKQCDKKSRTTEPQAHTALVKLNAVDLDEFLTTVHGKQ